MNDTLDHEYLQERAKRMRDTDRKLLDSLETELAQSPITAPAAPEPAPAAPEKKGPGVVRETARAVVGAPLDAVGGIVSLWDDSAAALESAFLTAREYLTGQAAAEAERTAQQGPFGGGPAGQAFKQSKRAIVADNESGVGRVARGIGQFVVPFLGTYKVLGSAGAFSKSVAAKGMVAGAATDFAAFEAEEARLTDMLAEWTKDNPSAMADVLRWWADRDPNSKLESRARTAVEGMFLGGIAEGIFASWKTLRRYWQAKGKDVPEEIAQKVVAARGAEEEAATRETDRIRAALEEIEARKAATAKAGAEAKERAAAQSARAAREGKAAEIAAKAAEAEKKAAEAVARAVKEAQAAQAAGAAKRLEVEAAASGDAALTKVPEPPRTVAELDAEVVIGNRRASAWEEAASDVLVTGTRFTPSEVNVAGLIDVLLRKPGALRSADDQILLRNYADLAKEAEERLIADGVLPPPGRSDLEVVNRGTGAFTDTERRILREGGELPGEGPWRGWPTSESDAARIAAEAAQRAGRVQQAVEVALARSEGEAGGLGGRQGGFASPALLAHVAGGGAGALVGYEQNGVEGAFLGALAGLAGASGVMRLAKRASAAKAAKTPDAAKVSAFKNYLDDVDAADAAHFFRDADGLEVKASVSSAPNRQPRVTETQAQRMVEALVRGDVLAAADEAASWINWKYVDTDEDTALLMRQLEERFSGAAARVGSARMGDAAVYQLADSMGMTPKALKELNEDVAALAPRLMAARVFELASAKRSLELVQAIQNGGGGMSLPALIVAAHKQMRITATAMAYVKGTKSEVARGLRSLRLTAKTPDSMFREAMEIIESLGGLDMNVKELARLATLSPEQMAKASQKSMLAKTADGFLEIFINGLLSGPITHTVNATSNLLVAVSGVSEKTVSAAVGALTRSKDRTTFGEVGAQMMGMMAGIRDAVRVTARGREALMRSAGQAVRGDFRGAASTIGAAGPDLGNAWRTFASNTPVVDAMSTGKLDAGINPALTAENWKLDPNSFAGRAMDIFGSLVRVPGKALMTADEIFKTMHYRGQLHAQAFREASKKGLKGDDLVEEMARIIDDPSDAVREVALQEARYRTFTTELDGIGGELQKMVVNHPVLRLILPFVRTPVNIMKYSFERLGASKELWQDLAAGGARRELALGKLSTTGLIASAYLTLQAGGNLTGGLEKQKTAEELARRPPYSIRVPGTDTWIDYSRMEPLGSVLGMIADAGNLMGQQDAGEAELTAAGLMATIARNVTSRTYLEGLAGFFDAVSSGQPDKAERFIASTVAAAVPFSSALATASREIDPEMKEARGVLNRAAARYWPLNEDIPPHRDVFGRPVLYREGLGPDWLSPVRLAQEDRSPAAQEIARLDIDLQRPTRTLDRSRGVGVELTPKEYDEMLVNIGQKVRVGGKNLQERLDDLVASPAYQNAPEDGSGVYKTSKQLMIEKVYQTYVNAGRRMLIQQNAAVQKRFLGNRENALNALIGRPVVPLDTPAE